MESGVCVWQSRNEVMGKLELREDVDEGACV